MKLLNVSCILWRSVRLRRLIEREQHRPRIHRLRVLRLQALLLRVQDRLAEVLPTPRPAMAPVCARAGRRLPVQDNSR